MSEDLAVINRINLNKNDQHLDVCHGINRRLARQLGSSRSEDVALLRKRVARANDDQGLYSLRDPYTHLLHAAAFLQLDSFPRAQYAHLSPTEIDLVDQAARMTDRLTLSAPRRARELQVVRPFVIAAISHYTERRVHNADTPSEQRMTGLFAEVDVIDPEKISILTGLVDIGEGFNLVATSSGNPMKLALDFPLTRIQQIIPESPMYPL